MAEPTAADVNSREIRVFISSTFRDFMEERELLAKQVFPELNRRARERGVELVEVDLRWGVTQEQVEDGHALEICLKEIERCRPYFIGMLGDSYGSLTPPERQLLTAAPELLEKRQWLAGQLGQLSYTDLEIAHSLELLRDQQLEGRAFFYFRDPAWSDPKADAGEAGSRSDDPAERQKLELLRSRIRSSGHPLVEGLESPQAIADRIKEDLWALIDRQFPEGVQPDALEREERKHADYRRSRTRPGDYVGGEGYIQQLEGWIEAGHQQILITGESGSGKSALIANWMERYGQSHPADVVYAHHLGCTNDANALRPLLGRLIDTASARLLEAEVIREALTVPEDWWELVAKVAETLQTLGHWCQQLGKRWIWVLDGLDRLDPDDQSALPWLPLNLPDGVQVVASALACPAMEILGERGYTTLNIQPLIEKEQEQLIQRYLQRYTKELDGGLLQQILAHPLAGSPLFLKVLLEELRQCGRHDTLKQQLDFYLSSQTVDDLYERELERLENDGSGEAVKKVMTALWASRAGLTEPELLAITDLKPLQWAPIDLALEKAFGRNGNRLVFDHDYLRIAVQDRYLPTDEERRQAHSGLADWFDAKEDWDERDAEELPWQWQAAGRLDALREHVLNPVHLAYLSDYRDNREVINYWLAVKDLGHSELDELIAEAVEEEIEKRKEDMEYQIWFVDRIAALLNEAGLYRELLLRLRTLSLELEEATEGREQASMLASLALLANAHRDMGNFDEAVKLYQHCLEASEKLLGPEHPDTLERINALGILYREEGIYELAETYLNRALDVREHNLGNEHPDTLNSALNLGGLFHAKKDYELAETHYNRCLKTQKLLLGRQHRSTITTIGNLGLLYRKTGDYVRAEEYSHRALEASERLLGPDHPDTLAIIGHLGALHCQKGDYEQSSSYYLQALEKQERALGLVHPDTSGTLFELALLNQAHGKTDQAKTFFDRFVEAGKKANSANVERLDNLWIAGNFYLANGDYVAAEACYGWELEARERLQGASHRDTLWAIDTLANLFRDKCDYEQAAIYYRRELEIMKQQAYLNYLNAQDVNFLWPQYNLAKVLHKLGRKSEATTLLQELQKSMNLKDELDDNDRQDQAKSDMKAKWPISEVEELMSSIEGDS
jgi:nephrocystin-3